MAIKFIEPDFIQHNDPEEIQDRMMRRLPPDIDDMPGGFPYDFTMPTALEKSELIQYHLVRTLMLMFPMWAWGEWLDYHGETAGVVRKDAGYASGEITIEGLADTKIPIGTVFATASTGGEASIEFRTLEEGFIGLEGSLVLPVKAVVPGKTSNVLADTVVLASKPIGGVTRIYNEKHITGGTEQEGDEAYRERIQEANESIGLSFVGNDNDYIRWAKEVIGVGAVIVIPEWDGPGTVKLVLLDGNGQPANPILIQEVYTHIIHPENRLERKAPIGATLTIAAPEIIGVRYSGKIYLKKGYTEEYVEKELQKNLLKYYEIATKEGMLRYTKLASVLSNTNSIADYVEFLVNGEKQNIEIQKDQFPETEKMDFIWEESG